MDMRIHKLLNILLPPATVALLLLIFPLFLIFKFVTRLKSFRRRENVACKVVLITGASSGIGEYVAYEYAKKGARLALVARRRERLLAVAEKARHLGSPDAIAICADVSKSEDCRRFVEQTVNHFGQLDHLVNNAGITQIGMFGEATDFSDGRQVMDINFWGSVYGTHFAAPHLRKSKGKIIVTCSSLAFVPFPKLHFYSASKAALRSFYETLKIEFGPDIGITMVVPGVIESEMTGGDIVSQAGAGFIPMESTEGCAEAVVDKACGGDTYIVEPSWMRVLFWAYQCYAQLYGWCVRRIFTQWSWTPNKNE